ncbi:type VI secretion system protein [Paraburkholderia rhizosphaerae]|uniref:Type VI secretion system protein ImpL n=1 Tax=Paraburkholderia rhizosphaerae TaxID=480658 RepID=A0A4R8LUK1_9BURK|nr:type VI secretion system protein [Paraburkholderia rhizosphaerae]TDY51453.1 type VI secretion system protein ImpL [Paraburkholderia rhizosphaerae]
MLTSNLFLLSIAVLTVVVCIVLGVVLYFALHGSHGKPAAERKIVRLRADTLRSTFRQAVELIEGNIASRAERYNIPWIMVLDEGDDPHPLPVAQAGVASVLSSEAASPAATSGISWHFFDRGVVIDIKAMYLGSPEDDGDEKPWDEFLGLCRNYRQQRPFDSVVITVPAALLLAEDTDAQLELVRRAKLAHRRLWLAQNRFAMRFAVYVVITGCETLPGFAGFARALPEPMRASMLGWSSPFDLSTTYQSAWVDTAMASIERAVSDTSAELFALDTGTIDAGALLLLPARIDAMRAQLQIYIDELLRPSAYHEPFFFRGIYLTGDSSEFAQWTVEPSSAGYRDGALVPAGGEFAAADGAGDPVAADAAMPLVPYAGGAAALLGDAAGAPLEAERREPGGPLNELMRQPAFLRDLFDKKIFLEYGLARPSRSQHLTRPLVNRALRWGSYALLGVWGVGIVVATVQLSHRNGELVAALGALQRDAQDQAMAARRGQDLTADWYRGKALALIALNQHLRADPLWTVFLPGSWPIVDDLDQRVNSRFDQAFGEIALTALQREMFARVSKLTGTARDPSTGQLIVGDDCAAPALPRADSMRSDTLSIDELPEMRSLQQYVNGVDQFDAALQALQSLQRPSPDNADALRLVVRYALGAELQGNVASTLRYFYRDTDAKSEYRSDLGSGLAVAQLREALRCTLERGALRLNQRLFAANPLLVSEQSITEHLRTLSGADAGASGFAQVSAAYRSVVAGIDAQQDLLASGRSGWIRQTQFAPGAAYERMLARVAQNRLLGDDLAASVRARDDSAFQAFRAGLAQRFGGPDSGIVWVDKERRYAVSPSRLALRDGINALLSQPFMVQPRDLPLPTLPAGSVIVWDTAQLDQALALGDVRKRYFSDGLTKLPALIQPSVEQTLDAQFARLVLDQTAAAATPTPADADADSAAAFDAARARLARIKGLLTDMGALTQAADLDSVVSRDALERLRLVDAELTRAELYATRQNAGFDGIPNARPTVLAAFGVADVASLGPYLAQQSARALALGSEAAVYLAALDPVDAAAPLAQRWRAIERDLDRYKLKNPNSSLLMLEQFVIAAADAGSAGCGAKFPPRPSASGADDYFATLHTRLYSTLLARCHQGYADELRVQWASFSDAFNQSVAARAPFIGAAGAGVTGGAGAAGATGAVGDGVTADFGELGQVLKRYERVSVTFRDAGAGGATGDAIAVRRFIDNFDKVKTLLSPLYPTDDGGPSGYDVNVEFRANRTGEIAANQVIAWTLSIGAQSLSMGDTPSHPLHWDYGMPVTLTLRFAKDSPLTALADPRQRAFSTDGRVLTWQFSDPWALITFIGAERVPDTGPRADSSALLLKLDFPLGTASPADVGLLPAQAHGRAFVRVTLTPAGKKNPLPWPGSFPARAPDWTAL